MKLLVKYEEFFKTFSELENIDRNSIGTDWSTDVDDQNSEWESVYGLVGLKNKELWINIIPEIEKVVLDIKKQYNLPKELILTPCLWFDYMPKVEKSFDEIQMHFWFAVDREDLNKNLINTLSQKEIDELEYKIDDMHDEVQPSFYFDNYSEPERTENMRRLVNLLYFLKNNMTIYEYLLEVPKLDSETEHKESVKRTMKRLKRLHRQILDFFKNPNSVCGNLFYN